MRTIDCSACGRPLSCGVDAASCWCARVELDPAAREQLAAIYEDCLCPDCLAAAGTPHPDAEASWAVRRLGPLSTAGSALNCGSPCATACTT